MLADGFLPYSDLDLGEDADHTFARYTPIWADKTCLWVEFELEKPIEKEGGSTIDYLRPVVKYDIVDGGYSIAFCDLTAQNEGR